MPFSFQPVLYARFLHCTYLLEIRKGRWGHGGGRIAGRFMRECNQFAAAYGTLVSRSQISPATGHCIFPSMVLQPHTIAPGSPLQILISAVPPSEASVCCVLQYSQCQANPNIPFPTVCPGVPLVARIGSANRRHLPHSPLYGTASLRRFNRPQALGHPGRRMMFHRDVASAY